MAYSGARAGEVLQPREQDVRQGADTGIWLMDFAPGAGRVKNKSSRRIVPLHDHLIELGFIEWVEKMPAGRLFYEDREGEETDGKRSRKSVAVNRLGDWIRDDLQIEAVRAGEVQPNHGWRHRFTLEMTDLDVLGREGSALPVIDWKAKTPAMLANWISLALRKRLTASPLLNHCPSYQVGANWRILVHSRGIDFDRMRDWTTELAPILTGRI